MKKEIREIIQITAEDGHSLTQAVLAEDEKRIFFSSAFLGATDSADNYIEWTDEERQQWEEEHKDEETKPGYDS